MVVYNLVKMCGQQHFILKKPQFGNILYPYKAINFIFNVL